MQLIHYYEDLKNLHVGTEPMRCYYIPVHPDKSAASRLLSGEDWNFHLYASPESVEEAFITEGFESDSFDAIAVPSCWQSLGYDGKHYSGGDYVIPFDPPYVPDETPCGAYYKDFTVSGEETGKDLYLYFEGVEAGFYVWVNGSFVGYSQVSHSPSEFCISGQVHEGVNRLAVLVLKWTDGTYLEAQDKYRYNGIFRDVTLLVRPKECIFDYTVNTTVSKDETSAEVSLRIDMVKGNPEGKACLKAPDGSLLSEKKLADTIVFSVKNPILWNAENPVLYTLELTTPEETIVQKVGIREIEVKDGVVTINHKPVKMLGVNRHDSDPVTGYTVSREHVIRDLKMMKESNINAIRTSHYPNAPWFADLCCEYGFYLIAEADFETHGTLGLLGEEPIYRRFGRIVQDPLFHEAIMDRMQLNVIRDKNQCAVIIWSLGNESGYGKNLSDAAAWTKAYDPTRLVHYEGAKWAPPGIENDQSCLDMVSRMYPTVDMIKDYFKDPANVKPYILCEFVHAMGNGPGDIEDYLEVILPEPRIIGAFVWEWCDHASFEGKAEEGRDRYFYGGDYGEFPNDGNFCMDGLVYPDRRPHVGLLEWKNSIRPVRAELSEIRPIKVSLWNRLDYTDLADAVESFYEIKKDGVLLAEGKADLPSVAPHKKQEMIIPEMMLPEKNTYLKLIYRAKKDSALVAAGTELGFDQMALFDDSFVCGDSVSPSSLSMNCKTEETSGSFFIENGDMKVIFDRHLGVISSIEKDGKPQILEPMRFLTFRAPTNNDAAVSKEWRRAGYDRSCVKVYESEMKIQENCVEIIARFSIGSPARQPFLRGEAVWTVDSQNHIFLNLRADFDPVFPYMPRLGLGIKLSKGNQNVSYYGYGPYESYSDKHRASWIDRFETTVDDMLEDYVFPQENGSHFQCTDAKVGKLHAKSAQPFSFQAQRYSVEELDQKNHNFELTKSDGIYVALDYKQSGVGSNSCGPRLAEKYQLREEKIHWAIEIAFEDGGCIE